MIENHSNRTRRDLLLTLGGTGLWLAGCTSSRERARGMEPESEEGITPGEDLMREHGLLDRVLLVYEDAVRKLEFNEQLPPDLLPDATGIVRRFIEDYHEKQEEEEVFPRFEKADVLTDLVSTLRNQHEAGRRVTDTIQRLGTPASLSNTLERNQLVEAVRSFIRMYRPHAAREDTVLFPALRGVVALEELHQMGEDFEEREHEILGEEGFEKFVEEVAAIEKKLGIFELRQFTP
jgi:hemerythrin-like domain-containing protein